MSTEPTQTTTSPEVDQASGSLRPGDTLVAQETPPVVFNERITLSTVPVEGVINGSNHNGIFRATQKGVDSGAQTYNLKTGSVHPHEVFDTSTMNLVIRCTARKSNNMPIVAGTDPITLREDAASIFFRHLVYTVNGVDLWTTRDLPAFLHLRNRFFKKHNGITIAQTAHMCINNDEMASGIDAPADTVNAGVYNVNAPLANGEFRLVIPLDFLPGMDMKYLPTPIELEFALTSNDQIGGIFQTNVAAAEVPIINVVELSLQCDILRLDPEVATGRINQLASTRGLIVDTDIWAVQSLNPIVRLGDLDVRFAATEFSQVTDFAMLVPFYEARLKGSATAHRNVFPFVQPRNGAIRIEAYNATGDLVDSAKCETFGERAELVERFRQFNLDGLGDSEIYFNQNFILRDAGGLFAYLVTNRAFMDRQVIGTEDYSISFRVVFEDGAGAEFANIRYYVMTRQRRQLSISSRANSTVLLRR